MAFAQVPCIFDLLELGPSFGQSVHRSIVFSPFITYGYKLMKVGQHYYSTLYKGQEPLELLMVFNPDPSQLSLKFLKETSLFRIYHKTFQKTLILTNLILTLIDLGVTRLCSRRLVYLILIGNS